jgi:hypothetical protein
MNIYKICASCFIIFSLSACVYIPVVDKSIQPPSACETWTQKMTMGELLEKSTRDQVLGPFWEAGRVKCSSDDCLKAMIVILAAPVVVAGGSAIISGSIVVVGNTVHWMEYQGRCEDGYLNQSKEWFLNTLPTVAEIEQPDSESGQ